MVQRREASRWGVTKKNTVHKGKVCYGDFSGCLLCWWVSRDLESSFSSWCRDRDTLTNGAIPYKRGFLFPKGGFAELLLCLLFLKDNQLKIILTPKRHIRGRNIMRPFTFFTTCVASLMRLLSARPEAFITSALPSALVSGGCSSAFQVFLSPSPSSVLFKVTFLPVTWDHVDPHEACAPLRGSCSRAELGKSVI